MNLNFGSINVAIINDADWREDPGGLFGLVPRALWSRVIQDDDQHLLPVAGRCLLIRAGGKVIVVETGQGEKLTDKRIKQLHLTHPEGGLLQGLARHGIAPEDVDIVINTHLHADHCGGNTRFNARGEIVPTFPNAEYLVQRLEYADACFPNERTRATYLPENFRPLERTGQLRLLSGDETVVPGVRCVVTPGHTRAHQCVVIEDIGGGDRPALFTGDMATLAVHFARLSWLTAYDVEPLINLETKRRWQRWALENDALLIFEHEPRFAVGRIKTSGGGKRGDKPEVVPT
jgi:glyoxylase-like metal-dependent hydrolase (beta-lactamase superfamily II)